MASPKQLIENARSLINQGKIVQAQQLIASINDYKKYPEALYLLALTNAMTNNYSNAEKLFQQVLKKTQASDALLGNLGLSQLHQNKINKAIDSFNRALKINPDYYDAIVNLASCYKHINQSEQALKYAQMACKINQNNPAILNILASNAAGNGRINDAITLYNRSLALQPGQPQAYTLLSDAFSLAKDYDSAEDTLKKGIALIPDNPYLLNSLGNYYSTRNRHQEAISEYDKVLSRDKNNVISIAAKARSLIALQEFDTAQELLSEANNTTPDSTEIISELSNYHILHKDYEKAYRTILPLMTYKNIPIPGNIAVTYSIACQHTGRLEEAKNSLKSVINNNTSPPELLEHIHFSLGDIFDALKDYDKAFEHFDKANKIIPRPSDIEYYEAIIDKLINHIDRAFLDSAGTSEIASSKPVFIVGMPRSGTSLVEQIISCHPDTFGGGELTDLWKIGNSVSGAMNMLEYCNNFSQLQKEELNEYATSYLGIIENLSGGEKRVTDKLPHNFIHLGLIECLFPKANIIHCQRHPFDTCLSIYFKKFNDNHVYARKLDELARFYLKYNELMEHWYKNSSLKILNVQYEDMVVNQERETRKIISHIGLEWNDAVMNHHDSDRVIMTPSYHQASKPIYTGSMNRWKNYSKFIQPMIEVLGEPELFVR